MKINVPHRIYYVGLAELNEYRARSKLVTRIAAIPVVIRGIAVQKCVSRSICQR